MEQAKLLFSEHVIGTPIENLPQETTKVRRGYSSGLDVRWEDQGTTHVIGKLTLNDNKYLEVRVPAFTQNPTYEFSLPGNPPLIGFYVPAHRKTFKYVPVTQLDIEPQSLETFFNSAAVNISPNQSTEQFMQSFKRSLLSLATFAYADKFRSGNDRNIQLIEGFISCLSKVLPDSIGFQNIQIVGSNIILKTNTGDFLIDAASGGLSVLIQYAWLFHMASQFGEFLVLLDEPENHLHPKLQRILLPRLKLTFPQAQIIVATHSPIIATSIQDSSIFSLKFSRDTNRVSATKLDSIDRTGTANRALEEILGVESSMPVWVSEKLKQLASNIISLPQPNSDQELFKKLLNELKVLGIDAYISQLISEIEEQRRNNEKP